MRDPPIEIDAVEKYHKITRTRTREKANTIFNEVWQFAYVLGVRGRDFIDSTTNTTYSLLQGISKGDFQWDTIHKALALIYNHIVPGI